MPIISGRMGDLVVSISGPTWEAHHHAILLTGDEIDGTVGGDVNETR